MALTRQRQVLDGLDDLGGRVMRRAAKGYGQMARPIVEALGGVALSGQNELDAARLLEALGPEVFRRMDSREVEQRLADGLAQAGMIGVVSAISQSEAQAPARAHEE